MYITRYIIKDSIEENMLEIQNRKMLVAGAVTGASTANLEDLLSILK